MTYLFENVRNKNRGMYKALKNKTKYIKKIPKCGVNFKKPFRQQRKLTAKFRSSNFMY